MTAFDIHTVEELAADLPEWRRAQMKAAFEVFEALEEPTGAEEDWRYVDFDLSFSDLQPVDRPGDPLPQDPLLNAVGSASGLVRIIDGDVVSVDAGPTTVTRLRDLGPEESIGDLLPVDHNKLVAATRAFARDGAVITVPKGSVLETPFVVDVQSVTPGTASFPLISVRVEENAEARVLVVYRSAQGEALLTVPEVELRVADGARLRYLAAQEVDQAATGVVHQRVTLGRDADSRIGEVGLGGRLGRLDLGIDFQGDGCSSQVVGLYFGEDHQTLDYRMVLNHRGKRTNSEVFLKGAVEDDAESVFTGLLRIEKDAERTNTFETNRNLVLSENAKAHSVPNLEILCNDVMCGHASSVGPLEEEHLYYLMSRGLGRQRAERMLIRGFFQQVIDRLPIEDVAVPVAEEISRRFVTAQEEGRVS